MNQSKINRQTIIEKAAVLFNQKGVASTSLDEVVRAAGISKGCLYGHFQNKSELATQSVTYMIKHCTGKIDELLARENTVVGKIEAFFKMSENPLQSMFDGGCPIINFSVEADDTNPEINKIIKKFLKLQFQKFTRIINDGVESGELTGDIHPEEFAVKMFTSVCCAGAFSRVMNNSMPTQVSIRSLTKELYGHRNQSSLSSEKEY
ncbi:TetR/AcrR family transcriptional regulator [Pedobacter sp. L105]|uniref:TetR/AcrR family transcriptional regulator n=1 Tax=Pedobacter sp. L105 TaxID=1641871 RepID=UPI00131C2A33|nr:TetR/AcrR family transcriptional regulator [Pedobacter sp. L105]